MLEEAGSVGADPDGQRAQHYEGHYDIFAEQAPGVPKVATRSASSLQRSQ